MFPKNVSEKSQSLAIIASILFKWDYFELSEGILCPSRAK